jgi:hypothetical protein
MGGVLNEKTPPIRPSGRQDLNLRPLDPQALPDMPDLRLSPR